MGLLRGHFCAPELSLHPLACGPSGRSYAPTYTIQFERSPTCPRPGQPARACPLRPAHARVWPHPSARSPCIYLVMQRPCPALSMLYRARASSCAMRP